MSCEDASMSTVVPPSSRSFAELSRAVFGRSLTTKEALDLLMVDEFDPEPESIPSPSIWVGSVGYERHKDSAQFARLLRTAGIERLIDVRELPISRRRGYAKTALREAMEAEGIEYLHMKALGNPKCYRDLYKTGQVEKGRDLYTHYLLNEQRPALDDLVPLLRNKPTALMCVEDDPGICHRSVIVEALRSELGLDLEVAHLAEG
jgi:uncharacterized protein (DUF488 family)